MAGRNSGRPRGGGSGGRGAKYDRNDRPFKRDRPPAVEESAPEEEPRQIKRQKLPELKLPKNARVGDAEDGEIEWLEYMLRKEKNDGLEDGLDGELRLDKTDGRLARLCGYYWARRQGARPGSV